MNLNQYQSTLFFFQSSFKDINFFKRKTGRKDSEEIKLQLLRERVRQKINTFKKEYLKFMKLKI